MLVCRSEENPIITPAKICSTREDFEVVGTLNPGVATYGGKVLLMIRVAERVKDCNDGKLRVPICRDGKISVCSFQTDDRRFDFSDSRLIVSKDERYLTSMSYLLPAVSEDGIHFQPLYEGRLMAVGPEEAFGIEDARITQIGETYYITYSCASSLGICVNLVTTKDFASYRREGVLLPPDNKDVALFPDKIGDKYYLVHRPSTSEFGLPEIWVAESEDMIHWGRHRHVMGVRKGKWDSKRIGSSSVPVRTKDGWFMVYHGADDCSRYSLGACLLDANEPWRVIARTREPFMEPKEPYETKGFFGNVVFSCGSILKEDILHVYYGAADQYVCEASARYGDIMKLME